MSTTNNITRRISVSDFRLGIFSDYQAGTGQTISNSQTGIFDPTANGAATVEDTWGCCADRAGALVPLPKVSTGRTQALPFTAANYVANMPGQFLTDALVLNGVQEPSSVLDDDNPEVVTMQTFGYTTSGTSWSYLLVRRWKMWKGAGTLTSDVSFAKSTTEASQSTIAGGNLTPARGSAAGEESLINGVRKGFAWVAHPHIRADSVDPATNFQTGAIPAADQALTDYDTKYAIAGAWPTITKHSQFGWFPNFDAPFTVPPSIPGFLDGSANNRFRGAYLCTTHQGRVVAVERYPSQYEGSSEFVWKDRVCSTGLLRMSDDGGGGEFVEENTSLTGMIASLSADELLVVKHNGGGYLLRGSVPSPTVVKLPFIESTYGVVSSPAATGIGLVYGTRNGVFVWEGGETSKCLSPQLDGFFWQHQTTNNYEGHQGRFAWWYPWVMVPNGFMYDTNTQSWWRLDNPAGHLAYNVFAVSEKGKLFAFPYKIDADNSLMWNTAQWGTFTDQWSWKSQPLIETRDNAWKIRDIQILATAADVGSTITVTLTGFDDTGASVTITPEVFTLADNLDRPQLITKDVTAQASALSYVQVKIVAANTTSSLKAPKLHSISLGVVDTNPLRKTA
jgi:hypothetical protein